MRQQKDIYIPIQEQLNDWIFYEENNDGSVSFRANHDRDCVLTGGNLYADTIISLWFPTKYVLKALGTTGRINKKATIYLLQEHLEKMLPADQPLVQLLAELYILGRTRANVMILPDRRMQTRGRLPLSDYMPGFLYHCFAEGMYSNAFVNDEELVQWLNREHLECFFYDAILDRDHIKDLSMSGNLERCTFGDFNLEQLLMNYIDILRVRSQYYCSEGDS